HGLLHAARARTMPRAPQMTAQQPPPRLLREAMSRHVGLERDATGLTQALDIIGRVERAGNGEAALLNMVAAARLVTAAALARQESRGGHWRSDFPRMDAHGDRTFLTLAAAEAIAAPAERHAAP